MSKKSRKKKFITGGVVIAVFITLAAVIAFVHYQRTFTALLQKNTVHHKPEAAVEDSHSASSPDNRSTSHLSAYDSVVRTFREADFSDKHKALSGRTTEGEKTSGEEGRKNHRGRKVTDRDRDERGSDSGEILSEVPPPVENSRQGNFDDSVEADEWKDFGRRVSSWTDRSQEDPDQDYQLPSEEGDEEGFGPDKNLPEETEDLLEDTEPANRSIAVSRAFISGSVDEKVISVALFVLADSNITSRLIIGEVIPAGWELVESFPGYNTFHSQTGEITWQFSGKNVMSRRIKYTIQKIEHINSRVFFNGYYLYNDSYGNPVEMAITGVNGT